MPRQPTMELCSCRHSEATHRKNNGPAPCRQDIRDHETCGCKFFDAAYLLTYDGMIDNPATREVPVNA